jgi:GH25 family lysozyme M1 (1,4-beta-N-acetylmuramidase)
LIRGGYHFAHPDSSSGAKQAEYFLAHGGGWSNDGKTLPGMLDIEYNPSGATCYGISKSAMVAWVKDFGETYKSKTGRYPMIYTTADWWNTCTGGSTAFSKDYPLVLARYSTSVGTIPGGWSYQSFWQNSDKYTYGGDSDLWNGSEASLKTFAKGA